MGHTELPASPYPGIERGAVKYMLDENALPAEDDLIAQIKDAHGQGRGMAFHCVTRTELVIALNALERAGAVVGAADLRPLPHHRLRALAHLVRDDYS